MIKHVFIDLDDTVLNFHKAETIALTKTLTHFGLPADDGTIALYKRINIAHWKQLELGKLTRPQVLVGRYAQLFDELGVDKDPVAATKYYEDMLCLGFYFVPHAQDVLNALYSEYNLYLASNGTARVQLARIESSGIGKYFKNIFISQHIGADKPSKEYFNKCFAQISGFSKDEAVIVGDSLTSDIQGGCNAGIKTVWFNPNKVVNSTAVKPDYEIENLTQLISLLKDM